MRRAGVGVLGSVVLVLAGIGVWAWTQLADSNVAAPSADASARQVAGDEPRAPTPLEDAGPADDDPTQLSGEEAEAARSELESSAAAAVAAVPVDTAPRCKVVGRVLDEKSRAPLPMFLVRVHDRNHQEDAWTDAEGKFSTTSEFVLGRVRIDPLDQPARRRPAPSQSLDHFLDDDATRAPHELELAVPTGPTFQLAIEPVEGVPLGQISATLLLANDDDRDRVGPEVLRPDALPGSVAGTTAPAPDVLRWVRFPAVPPQYEHAERIELRSSDGVWTGDAAVSAVAGSPPGAVKVKLDARAALSGRVVDVTGAPVANASIDLREEPAAERGQRRATTTDESGRYRFQFLRPRTYAVTVKSLRCEAQESRLELAPLQIATFDATLTPKPPAGAIRGQVVTDTGISTPRARLQLSVGDRSIPPIAVDLSWTTLDGRKIARFDFPALPAGSYTLRVDKQDWFTWEPVKQTVAPPREDLRIVVHDDIASCDYVVRARDRDNGLLLDALHVMVEFEDGPSGERRVPSNVPFEWGVPIERKFTWRVEQLGYAAHGGDERDFQLEERVNGRLRRVVELDLEPGFGDTFRAVRRDGKGPIEAIELLADGRSLGKTGKDGTLKVLLHDRPDSIEARSADWVLQGRADLRPSWRRKDHQYVILRFNPKPRNRKG